MFHLMLQKILHKKWMAASLLIGNILLVAIAVSHPMYQEASRNRMLTDEFANYMKDNNAYPMIIDVEGLIRKNAGITDTKRIREFANTAAEQFGVSEVEKKCVRSLVSSVAVPTAMYDRNAGELKTLKSTAPSFRVRCTQIPSPKTDISRQLSARAP